MQLDSKHVLVVAMVLVVAGTFAITSSRRDRSERLADGFDRIDDRRGADRDADVDLSDAYALRILPMEGLTGRFSPEVQDAIADVLSEAMEGVEIVRLPDPDDDRMGGLGNIKVYLQVEEQAYGESGSAGVQGYYLPRAARVEVLFATMRGGSNWSGRHDLEAEVNLPSSLRTGANYGLREQYARELAEQLVEQLPDGGRFRQR